MNRLNRAIAWYNAIREGSHETEVALIEKEISAIDQLLGRGVEELTWNDDCKLHHFLLLVRSDHLLMDSSNEISNRLLSSKIYLE